MFHNIEKSGFRKGEYVGYCQGRVFHIRRGQVEGWKAIEQNGLAVLYGRTLRELSAKLVEFGEAQPKVTLNSILAEYTGKPQVFKYHGK